MVKDRDGPGQLTTPSEYVGVTVIVATTGDVPVLIAVKDGTGPLPEAGSPIAGNELVQEYVVVPPGLTVENSTSVVLLLLQTT